MRVLFIGDVVGEPGCDLVRKVLPGFKRMQGVDFCIINGENSARGNGITPQSCEHLLTSGADALTGGNHSLRRPEIYRVLEEESGVLLRPFNLHRSAPGKGLCVLEKRGLRLGVANLMGRIDMDDCENPFDSADAIVPETCKFAFDVLVIDMHRSKGDGHAVLFQRDCPVVGGNHLVWTRGGCMDEAFVNTAIFHSYGQVVPCAREFGCYSVMAR